MLVLAASLVQCLASFLLLLRLRGRPSAAMRADWLHRSCGFVLRRLGIRAHAIGSPPREGLIVSNHLSYLDIVLYGAAAPCVFVAKEEVRSWPMLGLLASLGGTVFVKRERTASAASAAREIEALLADGILVLIFPEGTSSDGSAVLRFYPSLFEPAIRAAAAVHAAAIAYSAGPEVPESSLCYYGDITFAPHLLETLALADIQATLSFSDSGIHYADRKAAAAATWSEVAALRGRITGK